MTEPREMPHLELAVADADGGMRLDKALSNAAADGAGLSRSRLVQLISEGAVTDQTGRTVSDLKRKVKPGERFTIHLPPPVEATPQPEDIALDIHHEDAHLIVVAKPAGMVVHPAPGAPSGTLVNALLAHCGDTLSGIGGELRPGIVHRIDKETSGLLVVAKSQAAHAGLSALFAAHEIERSYHALAWGCPDRADPRLAGISGVSFEPGWIRVETLLDRHKADRKRMAVSDETGRNAITRLNTTERFGAARPFASLLECRLQTGRTHQIRVHAAHIGHALIGDPVYGRVRKIAQNAAPAALRERIAAFPRQALHATTLGFVHPVTREPLRFHAPLPPDFCTLLAELRQTAAMPR